MGKVLGGHFATTVSSEEWNDADLLVRPLKCEIVNDVIIIANGLAIQANFHELNMVTSLLQYQNNSTIL